MSVLPVQEWIDSFARFEIVFEPVGAREPHALHSAPDGDRATLAFYEEWERLSADHAVGELLLVCRDPEPCILLRQPLG